MDKRVVEVVTFSTQGEFLPVVLTEGVSEKERLFGVADVETVPVCTPSWFR